MHSSDPRANEGNAYGNPGGTLVTKKAPSKKRLNHGSGDLSIGHQDGKTYSANHACVDSSNPSPNEGNDFDNPVVHLLLKMHQVKRG